MTVTVHRTTLTDLQPSTLGRNRPGAALWAFLRRDWSIAWSYRLPFFIGLGQTVLTLGFLYFLGRLVGPRIVADAHGLHGGYFAFAVIGASVLTMFSNTLVSVALRLRTDQTTGTLEVLFTMPPRPALTVLGSAFYQVTYAAVSAMLTVAGAVVLGMRFDVDLPSALVALAAVVASLVLFCSVGVALAAYVLVFKRGETLTTLAAAGVSLLGGVYYPVALMPRALRIIADALPFTWSVNVLRGALLGAQAPALRLGELAAAAAVMLWVSLWLFGAALRHAQRQGTLGQY